jgi:hypothetical protein
MATITIQADPNIDYTNLNDFNNFIQAAIDALNADDEVKFSGDFNIGENTIKVNKPLKIRGASGVKPKITGTSGSVMKGNTLMDCGIFSILTGGTVEITNLDLEHTPGLNKHFDPNVNNPVYPDDPNTGMDNPMMMCHGSATVAYFVDNLKPSSLRVINCDIFTSATAGISMECINKAKKNKPVRHDFIIRHCNIINVPGQFINTPLEIPGGNWLGVRFGPMEPGFNEPPPFPVDVRGSYFEVSDCNLNPAKFAGIAVWLCLSDSETKFVIANNDIAGNLSMGIMFGFEYSNEMCPNGTALILNNEIHIKDYFPYNDTLVSAGISAQIANDDKDKSVKTIITHNRIHLLHTSSASFGNEIVNVVLGGIVYTDLTEEGSKNASAVIDNNILYGGAAAPPYWGICLRGSANNVIVEDNDLTALTAAHAQIFVDGYSKGPQNKPVLVDAHNCIFSRNLLGKVVNSSPAKPPEAAIVCNGRNNRFFDNDFRLSSISGWTQQNHTDGIGFVKISDLSKDNFIILDPEKFPEVSGIPTGWWDETSPYNYKFYWDVSNQNEEVWLPKLVT